jgi:hypothetical protein
MIKWSEVVAKHPKIDFGNCAEDIECREGWNQLIDDLCTELDNRFVQVKVRQIKEKFGGLRFYVDLLPDPYEVTDAAQKVIWEYEDKSYHVCEVCGEPGKLHAKGWYQTLCDKHLQEYLDRK